MMAQVLRAGPLASVQDLGRFGRRAIGVGTGGALDGFAARVSNLLVGNDATNALLEITLGNFRLRLNDDRLLAWCGGAFDFRIAENEIPAGHVCRISSGEEIIIKNAKLGCRMWLAISGGIDVPVVLDSRSTDLRAEFGGLNGRALRDGDDVPLGQVSSASRELMRNLGDRRVSSWSAQREWTNTAIIHLTLRYLRGADWNRFEDSAHHALTNEQFTVTPEADRMGARLDGPELQRKERGDLLSEAVAPGTIQVPPNGKPILLLGDCQTIGGYPKIAHVITVDLPIAAQLRPGDNVRFQETSITEAHSLLLERERDFTRFRIGLALKNA
jgi:antagonist of KipI